MSILDIDLADRVNEEVIKNAGLHNWMNNNGYHFEYRVLNHPENQQNIEIKRRQWLIEVFSDLNQGIDIKSVTPMGVFYELTKNVVVSGDWMKLMTGEIWSIRSDQIKNTCNNSKLCNIQIFDAYLKNTRYKEISEDEWKKMITDFHNNYDGIERFYKSDDNHLLSVEGCDRGVIVNWFRPDRHDTGGYYQANGKCKWVGLSVCISFRYDSNQYDICGKGMVPYYYMSEQPHLFRESTW